MKMTGTVIHNPRARLRPTSAPSLCPLARHIYSWAIYHWDASSPTGGEEAPLSFIPRGGVRALSIIHFRCVATVTNVAQRLETTAPSLILDVDKLPWNPHCCCRRWATNVSNLVDKCQQTCGQMATKLLTNVDNRKREEYWNGSGLIEGHRTALISTILSTPPTTDGEPWTAGQEKRHPLTGSGWRLYITAGSKN